MQLHGRGLLKRLKILLGLYKSHSILVSTTHYQGHCSTSLLLCIRLLQQSLARKCNVTFGGQTTNIDLVFSSVFFNSWKDKHLLSFVWHMNFGLSCKIHINHCTKWSAKTDGQHRLLIRAEPVTAIGIGREGRGVGGCLSPSTWYENCVVVLCTSLWEFLNKPIWW